MSGKRVNSDPEAADGFLLSDHSGFDRDAFDSSSPTSSPEEKIRCQKYKDTMAEQLV